MEKIVENDLLIPFKAEDINGETINLIDYMGQKLYLVFFRKAACPFCNMGVRELIKKHDEFIKKGIKVVALFASSKAEILKYAGEQKAPFPIIPDEKYNIYKKYGIDISYKGMLKTMFNPGKVSKAITGGFFSLKTTFQDPVLPADFLIDEEQNVVKAHYGNTYDDHLPVSKILEWDIVSTLEMN
ncbi:MULTISPECIES: peroxiredoxin family protein [Aquimarina]|uniref:peroxiredoxin family protein n=1 Tax=Aquimarina TaxID=290174 RepID=UPI000D697D08|nr:MULTISPECIES: peroxiredoxin-like family protein [Aquimarina]